mmetsp:Transcript_3442/g.9786  ORF Transcript_3442/g.9786 Transcript_3442/m.9786 type:complete len:1522 (-) Transcript_3442:109-4674(-)|eukprot:CAMPEP_0119560884 /NCGR_PEP_ID=MMETSP1352-20130426/16103_1 /TAXON_ID=265584 /ORGANISM="Stauroneis constricta, Strain CCMP1120" /LENGTH=1521 /DNA_ID=CAMNT_0007608951 /DNA_START=286 /DNA_END=4851 /DNA_ORIENTATION=+
MRALSSSSSSSTAPSSHSHSPMLVTIELFGSRDIKSCSDIGCRSAKDAAGRRTTLSISLPRFVDQKAALRTASLLESAFRSLACYCGTKALLVDTLCMRDLRFDADGVRGITACLLSNRCIRDVKNVAINGIVTNPDGHAGSSRAGHQEVHSHADGNNSNSSSNGSSSSLSKQQQGHDHSEEDAFLKLVGMFSKSSSSSSSSIEKLDLSNNHIPFSTWTCIGKRHPKLHSLLLDFVHMDTKSLILMIEILFSSSKQHQQQQRISLQHFSISNYIDPFKSSSSHAIQIANRFISNHCATTAHTIKWIHLNASPNNNNNNNDSNSNDNASRHSAHSASSGRSRRRHSTIATRLPCIGLMECVTSHNSTASSQIRRLEFGGSPLLADMDFADRGLCGAIPLMPHLEYLKLHAIGLVGMDRIPILIQTLRKCQSLQVLDLSNNAMGSSNGTNTITTALCRLSTLPHLESLILQGNGLTNEDAVELFLAFGSSVEVDLANNPMVDTHRVAIQVATRLASASKLNGKDMDDSISSELGDDEMIEDADDVSSAHDDDYDSSTGFGSDEEAEEEDEMDEDEVEMELGMDMAMNRYVDNGSSNEYITHGNANGNDNDADDIDIDVDVDKADNIHGEDGAVGQHDQGREDIDIDIDDDDDDDDGAYNQLDDIIEEDHEEDLNDLSASELQNTSVRKVYPGAEMTTVDEDDEVLDDFDAVNVAESSIRTESNRPHDESHSSRRQSHEHSYSRGTSSESSSRHTASRRSSSTGAGTPTAPNPDATGVPDTAALLSEIDNLKQLKELMAIEVEVLNKRVSDLTDERDALVKAFSVIGSLKEVEERKETNLRIARLEAQVKLLSEQNRQTPATFMPSDDRISNPTSDFDITKSVRQRRTVRAQAMTQAVAVAADRGVRRDQDRRELGSFTEKKNQVRAHVLAEVASLQARREQVRSQMRSDLAFYQAQKAKTKNGALPSGSSSHDREDHLSTRSMRSVHSTHMRSTMVKTESFRMRGRRAAELMESGAATVTMPDPESTESRRSSRSTISFARTAQIDNMKLVANDDVNSLKPVSSSVEDDDMKSLSSMQSSAHTRSQRLQRSVIAGRPVFGRSASSRSLKRNVMKSNSGNLGQLTMNGTRMNGKAPLRGVNRSHSSDSYPLLSRPLSTAHSMRQIRTIDRFDIYSHQNGMVALGGPLQPVAESNNSKSHSRQRTRMSQSSHQRSPTKSTRVYDGSTSSTHSVRKIRSSESLSMLSTIDKTGDRTEHVIHNVTQINAVFDMESQLPKETPSNIQNHPMPPTLARPDRASIAASNPTSNLDLKPRLTNIGNDATPTQRSSAPTSSRWKASSAGPPLSPKRRNPTARVLPPPFSKEEAPSSVSESRDSVSKPAELASRRSISSSDVVAATLAKQYSSMSSSETDLLDGDDPTKNSSAPFSAASSSRSINDDANQVGVEKAQPRKSMDAASSQRSYRKMRSSPLKLLSTLSPSSSHDRRVASTRKQLADDGEGSKKKKKEKGSSFWSSKRSSKKKATK